MRAQLKIRLHVHLKSTLLESFGEMFQQRSTPVKRQLGKGEISKLTRHLILMKCLSLIIYVFLNALIFKRIILKQ